MQTLYIIPIRFTITFKVLNLNCFLSDIYLQHFMAIILSTFLRGYRGKTTDFALTSQHHRTIVAHFLNQGKWNDFLFSGCPKKQRCIFDLPGGDYFRSAYLLSLWMITIASHTKLSSQALHPIEAAYFHQSHLKGRQDYGHQIVSVMLSAMESL